jgi:hypothetical protein
VHEGEPNEDPLGDRSTDQATSAGAEGQERPRVPCLARLALAHHAPWVQSAMHTLGGRLSGLRPFSCTTWCSCESQRGVRFQESLRSTHTGVGRELSAGGRLRSLLGPPHADVVRQSEGAPSPRWSLPLGGEPRDRPPTRSFGTLSPETARRGAPLARSASVPSHRERSPQAPRHSEFRFT